MIEHLTEVKNILMIPKAYLRDKKKHNTKVVRDTVLFLMLSSCSTIFFNNAKLSKNISSLKDMRTAIHKLLPEDLENPIKENVALTSGDQGHNEDPIEDHCGTTLVSCTYGAYQELFEIVHKAFSVEQFEYLIHQIRKHCFTN
jgi:hypothetical protein